MPTYPHSFEWDLEPTDIKAKHGEATGEELEALNLRLRVPGRVRSIRQQGKIVFADLHDGREKVQLFIRKNQLPEQALLIVVHGAGNRITGPRLTALLLRSMIF